MKKSAITAAIAGIALSFTICAAAASTFTNPIAPGADPFVLKDDDGTYYLYATGGDPFGYRVYSSKNLVEWTAEGYCLLKENLHESTSSRDAGTPYFWAPEVIKYNGKYYMTVTYDERLFFAVSDSPLGPFVESENTLFSSIFKTIDGHFFLDKSGKMYFYFVSSGSVRFGDSHVPYGNNIWGCELDMETLKAKEDTIKLLVTWDRSIEVYEPVTEGPFMVENDGTYYLTFSSDGYPQTSYSIHYATSSSPLGDFKRDPGNVTLRCDDLDYADRENPHLYGTGHHSFVEAPSGKDMLIIYHCHRSSYSYNPDVASLVSPRSVCADLAWFEDGKLLAGSKDKPTVPTAVAQPLFEGTSLERNTYFSGAFEKLPSLPKVYVSSYDGIDSNPGTKEAPVASISKAIGILKKGGTIVLMQSYTGGNHLEIEGCRGPLMITAEHGNVVFTFKYLSINSPIYFDNIYFAPECAGDISVIECNFNDVVMGEGVSCLNSPHGNKEYPYLVGGRWQYGGESTDSTYDAYRYSEDKLTSTKSYSITVLGGKWALMEAGTVDYKAPLANSAPNGKLVTSSDGLTPTVPANATKIQMTVDSTTAFVNGESKTLDAAPVIRNSRTMLPVRFVAENLGATVGWDDATKTVSIKRSDVTIEIVIGADKAKVNGKEISLDSPAFIESSRTYLPVRVVAENLGATVSWDDATKTATLEK